MWCRVVIICLLRKCGPSTAIMNRVVTSYLYRHPEKLHQSGMALIFEAVAEAYPCKQ
jgi:hypothetical protein